MIKKTGFIKPSWHIVIAFFLLALFVFFKNSYASVNPLSGNFYTSQTDLILKFQSIQIDISRSYNSGFAPGEERGQWFFHPFHKKLLVDKEDSKLFLMDGDMVTVFLKSADKNAYFSRNKEKISYINNEYVRFLKDGRFEIFNENGNLSGIIYPHGKTLDILYNKGRISEITSEGQSLLKFTYNGQGLIEQISAYNGETSRYTYDEKGALASALIAGNILTKYNYDEQNRLIHISYQTGDFIKIKYHADTGTVLETVKKDGATKYSYKKDEKKTVKSAAIESPLGIKRVQVENNGRFIRNIDLDNNASESRYDENGLLTEYKDPHGNTVGYRYDTLGRLDEITYPDDSKESFSFLDRTSLVKRKVLQDSSAISYSYNNSKQLVKVSGPGNAEISYKYNNAGLVESVSHGIDQKIVSTYTYNSRGFLIKEVDPLGRTTKYKRDAKGRIIETVEPSGKILKYKYNNYGFLTKAYNSSRTLLTREYDKNLKMTRYSDSTGLSTRFEYNESGNLKSVLYPKGAQDTYEYDKNGLLRSALNPKGEQRSYEYNKSGSLTKMTDPDEGVTSYKYDALGNVIEVKEPSGYFNRWQYDEMNRITSVISPGGIRLDYTFDSSGRLTAEKNAIGNIKKYFYDPSGNLTKVTLPDGEETSYGFDTQGFGNPVSALTPDKREYKFKYDLAGRLVQEKKPWGETIQYSYDKADNLIKKASSGGKAIQYTYDRFDRLTNIKTSDGYEQGLTHDANGKVIKIQGKGFKKNLSYNEYGELVTEEYPLLGKKIKYTYDKQGNRLSLEVPGHLNIRYGYDNSGHLTTVGYGNGKEIHISYDKSGRKTQVSYPNGIKIKYSYNSSNLLDSIAYEDSADKVIEYYHYTYDKTGRITGIKDSKGITKEYSYDSNGQLIQSSSKSKKTAYRYGPSFKRISEVTGDKKKDFTYNESGQLIASEDTKITYDSSGNISSKTASGKRTGYSFNSLGRLTRIKDPAGEITYSYSPDGQRVRKSMYNRETYYLYDGLNLLMVLDKGKNPVKTFIHALEIDTPLVMLKNNNALFYLPDHLGSTTALAGKDGKIKTRYEYDSFGRITAGGDETGNPLTYTGRFYDHESGLYNYRARYYEPELGVFLSPDPFPKSTGNPQEFNEYTYVHNDPVNYKDPLGLYVGSELFWRRVNSDWNWMEELYKEWGWSADKISAYKSRYWRKLKEMYPTAFGGAPRPTPTPGSSAPAPGRTVGARPPAAGGTAGVTRGAPAAGGTAGVTSGAQPPGPTVAARPPAAGGTAGVTKIQGAKPPLTALTEGKSSFGKPPHLGQNVSGGTAAIGVLTGVAIGWEVGTKYDKKAAQEGRNMTPEEYAKSAAESAARAAAAVGTLGASEGVMSIGQLGSEAGGYVGDRIREAASKRAQDQMQDRIALRLSEFVTRAAALVSQAGDLKVKQDQAIEEAKSWHKKAENKLNEINQLQPLADNQVICRECQKKIGTLKGLPAEADGFKEPLTKNRDLARQEADFVCNDPTADGTEGSVQMAESAAALANGNSTAIKRIAGRAKSLSTEISNCTAAIEANNEAINNAQSTIGKIDKISNEAESYAASARNAGLRARTAAGECNRLRNSANTIYDMTAPDPSVGTPLSTNLRQRQEIKDSLDVITGICNGISSNANKGDTYGRYADIFVSSVKTKAQTLKAKLSNAQPCTIESPPAGLVEDLSALAGASEVLVVSAKGSYERAKGCFENAQEPEPGEDTCPPDEDSDNDGICDDLDKCPGHNDKLNADGDGVPDGCDKCPGHDDSLDLDEDGVPNGCDICLGDDKTGDTDKDKVCNSHDECPGANDFLDDNNNNIPDCKEKKCRDDQDLCNGNCVPKCGIGKKHSPDCTTCIFDPQSDIKAKGGITCPSGKHSECPDNYRCVNYNCIHKDRLADADKLVKARKGDRPGSGERTGATGGVVSPQGPYGESECDCQDDEVCDEDGRCVPADQPIPDDGVRQGEDEERHTEDWQRGGRGRGRDRDRDRDRDGKKPRKPKPPVGGDAPQPETPPKKPEVQPSTIEFPDVTGKATIKLYFPKGEGQKYRTKSSKVRGKNVPYYQVLLTPTPASCSNVEVRVSVTKGWSYFVDKGSMGGPEFLYSVKAGEEKKWFVVSGTNYLIDTGGAGSPYNVIYFLCKW